jgi:hypothetical protein
MATTIPDALGAWFVKDPTIYYSEQQRDSGGASLQDIRAFYLKEQKCENGSVLSEPWYNPTPQELASGLCIRCRHINFSWLLENRQKPRHGPILILRHMIATRDECAFCRLALQALSSANDAPFSVQDLEGDGGEYRNVCCWISSESLHRSKHDEQCLRIQLRPLRPAGGSIGRSGVIHQLSNDNGHIPPSGRRITSMQVDFNLLKSWITRCERDHQPIKTHKLVANAALLYLKGWKLRLIDVEEMCVKVVGHDTRYVALSYVWGGVSQLQLLTANYEILGTKGSLRLPEYRNLVPRTILDAIDVVAGLAERYIWVDSLCIIQDGRELRDQIRNMNSIYSNAAWTLIAASGNSSCALLPRIDKTNGQPADKQYPEQIHGNTLGVCLPTISVALRKSPWSTRAWTFQESVLSHRQLIFTEDQMYFTCCHGNTFTEDMMFEVLDVLANARERHGHISGLKPRTNFEVYAGAIEEYTRRNITYSEDILKAFTGVLSALESSFRSTYLFGLPKTELDQALLWFPVQTHRRRESSKGEILFPSWAWAGWVGGVKYVADFVLSRVQWYDPNRNRHFTSNDIRGPGYPLNDRWYQDIWTEIHPQPGEYRGYGARHYEKDDSSALFLHPISTPTEMDSRKNRTYLGFERLHFRALASHFTITGEHSLNVRAIIHCTEAHHGICALNIFNKSGIVVGTVQVPATATSSLQPGSYEFLRLSRTRLACDFTSHNSIPTDLDEALNEEGGCLVPTDGVDHSISTKDYVDFDEGTFDINVPWCIYYVMLVQTEQGISRRVGLGKIHIKAFLMERPYWKDVILA